MPEPTLRLLCTSFIDQSAILRLAERNVFVQSIELIKIIPIINGRLRDRIQELSETRAVVVFSSQNAVESVKHYLQQSGKKPSWEIYCVGPFTGHRVRSFFGPVSVNAIENSSAALADRLVNIPLMKNVVFFCGDQRRDELPDTLAAQDIKVEEIIVYHTQASPVAVDDRYDGILFFSPSGVASFFRVNAINRRVVLFAIGPSTADSLKKMTSNEIILANAVGRQRLLDQAVTYFDTRKLQEH